jgi:cytoskeletal protein RodZ
LSQCGQFIGSKETAMPARRFERIALAQFLVVGCAVVFGLIGHVQAQPIINPPPAPPPPTFNPSSPNTVPQPSYTPTSPTTPSTVPATPSTVPATRSTVPGSEVTPRANEEPSSTTARSRRRTSAYGQDFYYRPGPIILGPPPVACSSPSYAYGCAWRRWW